jgi:hypothetical protein
MRASLTIALVLVAAVGCINNAAFELEIGLPPGPTGDPVFALLQPRDAAENPFGDEWRGDDLQAIQLIPGMAQTDNISILSKDGDVDLALKVRFCVSPTCGDLMDASAPERWFEFEHPFYIGARTSWRPPMGSEEILAIPTVSDSTPLIIARCQIRGCVDGELSSYCRTDGRHLCE